MCDYINIDLIQSVPIIIEIVGGFLLIKEFLSRQRYTILSKDEETPSDVYETGRILLDIYFKDKSEKQRRNWGVIGSICITVGLFLQLIAINIIKI